MVAATTVAGCFAGACAAADGAKTAEPPAVKNGSAGRNTNFSLATCDGKTVSLDNYAGKPVLVIFMSSTCIDCKNAAPTMKKLAETYGPKGIAVVGLAMDTAAAPMREFAQKYQLAFPIGLNGKPVAKNYRSRGVPNFYLLDKTHSIAKFWYGADGGSAYEKDMFNTLDEMAARLAAK